MSLGAAILGFLRLEPTTGYLLRKRFQGSVGSFWSVTQSQIYRELHRLEAGGLVTSTRQPGEGKPDRLVYELTDEGRATLEGWLLEPAEPPQLRHPLLLRLVLAADVAPAALDGMLAEYRASVKRTRAEYQARLGLKAIFSLARSRREAALWRLSIEHGLSWCDAELRWVDRARRVLRQKGTS